MPRSLRDNLLVSYEVSSEDHRIVLRTECRRTVPVERTEVRFAGVEAYHFRDDAFGGAVIGLETVPVEKVLSEHRAEIAASAPRAGWRWAADLETAADVLRAEQVQGFELTSSRGLSGWVLARTAGIVPIPSLLDVSDGGSGRGVYALDSEGARSRLEGSGIGVVFGDGRRLRIELSRHPASDDCVELAAEFLGAGGGALERDAAGHLPPRYASLVVYPGAGNLIHVSVRARRRDEGLEAAPDPAGEPGKGKSYFLLHGGRERPIGAGPFLLDCGEGRCLQLEPPRRGQPAELVALHAGPPLTRADFERMRAGAPIPSSGLTVSFGGANIAYVQVGRPYGSLPIEFPPMQTNM